MSLETLPPSRFPQTLLPYVEDVEKYAPGGYHPVDIGDVIRTDEQDYEVIHKLGHGGFSTVWADIELNVLQHLRRVAGPGHPNAVVLYDSFTISGPNGEHRCLAFPVLGPSLQKVGVVAALSGTVRHQVCQQVASAMTFLHHHRVCHGDLTLSNVVFELPDIQSMSPARVSQLLGPIKAKNLRLPNGSFSPHAPKQLIQTPDYSGLDYSLLTQVRIIDFGQAFFADDPPPSLGVPIDFFPPELCFGYLPSTKSDVWDLACVLFQIHTGAFLFPTFFQIFEILIGTMVGYLGPIPQHWKGRFKFDEYGYCELGRVQLTTEPEWWFEDKDCEKTIDGRLAKEAAHLSTRQRQAYVHLLHDMVAYEPEKRLSALDVIRRLRSAAFLDENSSGSV
ncbi:Uncharacterized protein TPAR_01723 [Tolypocladium paradoxum]|uniref:EKC/KEOPS complex subunit BUD32 n=1 Tax=Tolypocladium paradoxum TaxID=94208 RepID=A0A2S4L6L0_9HYPO|nr:Uncharacterized protein TPAR_01723 [Tolypocladium paradoxum]